MKRASVIAYDLETTRIAKGNPRPLYLTAYGAEWQCSIAITGIEHLADVLEQRFLTTENIRARFVAWNGNNYDVYFIAAALLHTDRYILRPYMTRSKNLRGLRVVDREDEKRNWEFLDGISMTGLTGRPLKDFLKVFAPEFQKLEAPNWDKEEFDAKNPEHVKYAERDSEGLYHGLMAAQSIITENFGLALQPTIGNLGIKIFQANIPDSVAVWEPPLAVLDVVRAQVMRGGYCFCARRYSGPVWKYDLNQAYAAAMREADLPSGRCIHAKEPHPYARTYIVRIKAKKVSNTVPFYYRAMDGVAVFGTDTIEETWITSIEHQQLKREGWRIEMLECYFWDDAFSMKEYVDKLEALRSAAVDGPSGAQGTMVKMIGNNSYGKTVEQLDGIEMIMANDKPDGWHDYNTDDEALAHIFFRFQKPMLREYHQPQLGAFITAHVRMVVRRAILQAPQSWLYADTDCVMFDQPIAASKVFPVDPKRYGAWKVEAEGDLYIVIAKKVYTSVDGKVKHAKGMNVKHLNVIDFEKWIAGHPPLQKQVQRQNFVKVMQGADMFMERERNGTGIDLKQKRA